MGNKLNIKWKEVEQLFEAGCTGQQVADYVGVHYDTLVKRCKKDLGIELSELKRQKRSRGDAMLLAGQFKRALKGSDTMSVWLGKNRLGQTDKIKQEVDMFSALSRERGKPAVPQSDMDNWESEYLDE